MPDATFGLNLSSETVLLFYEGRKSRVQVTTRDGQTLSLPWSILKPYVTNNGISGAFVISFDDQGKYLAIRRL